MNTPIKTTNWDLVSGLLILVLGAAFLAAGWHLRPGTLAEMGPGYVPRALSIGIIGLGVYLTVKALGAKSEMVDLPRLRPFLIVIACPILFGLLISPLGLIPTVILVTVIARFAEQQKFGWDAVLMPVAMAVFCVVVFVEFINLPIKLWP